MTRCRFAAFAAAVALLMLVSPLAQEREDRTLLSSAQMLSIINEASGERALHHLLELVPYQRVRPPSEYQGHFRESEVMARFAKEYGFSNVAIETFPSAESSWQPTAGELWMTAPQSRKLYDIHDVPLALGEHTPTGDVTAELVDIGGGRAEDLNGKDVAGKVVLRSSGGFGALLPPRGAVGIIGYASLRPNDYPDEILEARFEAPSGATSPTFGWQVSPKVGRELASMLARGQKITIRSIVKAESLPGKLEVVHAEIPGDGSTAEEVAIGGHLFEEYIKQGANDDNSGCAVTLQIGRAYLDLVRQGKLPKPRRTIDFQWVPEIDGTKAWLAAHPDKQKHLIGDLNFDMEGVRLTSSRSYWIMQRTPDTFPSYINDVGQSVMEYVSEVTRERLRYRTNGYAPSVSITSPNGSTDAFYVKIDKHYGSSDHVTYMQHGIPAVMFITWPDMWYHSSGDTPDKQDSTQLKRAAVVGTGVLAVLAAADDGLAGRVAAENLSRGTERMGESQRKGVGYLTDAADRASLEQAFKEARNAVQHQAAIEKAVVQSSAVLFTSPEDARRTLAPFAGLIDRRASALQDEVKAIYGLKAAQLGVAPAEPMMTREEQDASGLLVECVNGTSLAGCDSPREGGRRSGPRVPEHMAAEFAVLLGQHRTALDIRNFLGEFEPVPLADVMAVLRAREEAGVIKLTPKPPEASKPAGASKPAAPPKSGARKIGAPNHRMTQTRVGSQTRGCLLGTMTTIRTAVVGDEDLLATLNGFVQDLHRQRRPDHFKQTERSELVAWYRSLLEKPSSRAWIAEEHGRPVGYILAIFRQLPGNPLTHARAWLEIDEIAVDSSHRRQGIGRALVFAAVAEARAEGIHRVEAAAWSFNEDTHEVFRRLGFAAKTVRFELETGA